MRIKGIGAALAAAVLGWSTGAVAQPANLEARFDSVLGTQPRAAAVAPASHISDLQQRVAALAEPSRGRIGVMAVDLSTGQEVAVLADQRFPMASTSKIAVAATFLEGVEQGRWTLSSEFPLLIPRQSARFSSAVAPVTQGRYMPAIDLIEIMIARSSNPATDALLAAVGGPGVVSNWMRRNGITEFSLDRDIATLVRDDGEFNPAIHVDVRDSATPRAMVTFLRGLHEGHYLSPTSRQIILGAMSRTVTGQRRIRALMPMNAQVAHKTGSLNNTSSDVGIVTLPDGRAVAMAIYVTGQGTRLEREAKIASIARVLYDGFSSTPATQTLAQQRFEQGSGRIIGN
ncbi:serine hydrolase [Erythrobacteraceae bacterium CFH 75059]|uniref:serine hydrolase n=1 Tax=Qipengyuania thermophila TaxID=2509361 RepID=UPI00101F950E|nr:serine hydrolase [Qipengyuania thermophila]TCD04301.1 serine hydrolase [Erythrobacteraceae bacterium CFH 75059]